MSKFQSTVSVVAALASIFGAGAAGWKLAQESETRPAVESVAHEQEKPQVVATSADVPPAPQLPQLQATQVVAEQVPVPPPILPPPPVTGPPALPALPETPAPANNQQQQKQ